MANRAAAKLCSTVILVAGRKEMGRSQEEGEEGEERRKGKE